MKNLHSLSLATFLVCCLMGCWENDCPGIFYIPFETIPYQRTYKVGDTITVRSRFHKTVDGYNSENEKVGTYDMTGIKWKPFIRIYNLDSSFIYNAISKEIKIEFLSDSRLYLKQFSNGSIGIVGEYSFEKDSFKLSFKIFPKKKGKYYLSNHNGIEPVNPQEFPGMCRKNGWASYRNMNKGKDNNQVLLDSAAYVPFRDFGTGSKPFFWYGHFCFEVVD